MKVDGREHPDDLTATVRRLVRRAWAGLLARAQAGIEATRFGSRIAVPVRLQAEVKRRPRS